MEDGGSAQALRAWHNALTAGLRVELYYVLLPPAFLGQFIDVCSQFSRLLSSPLHLTWELYRGRSHLLPSCGPMVDTVTYYCPYICMVLESLRSLSPLGLNNSPVRPHNPHTGLYPHFTDQETEGKRSSSIREAWILEILALPFVDYQCDLGSII